MTSPRSSGHEGTPAEGMAGGSEPVEDEVEGSYVDSELDPEVGHAHHEPHEPGSYVDSELDPEVGHTHHEPFHHPDDPPVDPPDGGEDADAASPDD